MRGGVALRPLLVSTLVPSPVYFVIARRAICLDQFVETSMLAMSTTRYSPTSAGRPLMSRISAKL